MMKNRVIYFTVFFIIIMTSCDNKTEIVFDNIVRLHVDTIPITQIYSPTFMTLTGDILTVTSYGSDEMLHFYKTPALEYMHSRSPKGQGPDEFQAFPMICQNSFSDKLYLWGYTATSIREFIFKSDTLREVNKYDLKHYETFNQLHLVRDSLFVYSALPAVHSIKKYDLKNNRVLGEIALKIDERTRSNYGIIAANHTSIVYAYKFKKQIDIYDLESLQLKKRIIDKYNYVEPSMENDSDNIYHYTNVVAGKTYFYVVYQGVKSQNKPVNNDFIEVYDYDGNPIAKYVFDNISPYLFAVNETNHTLYGFSYNHEDYLLRCLLP